MKQSKELSTQAVSRAVVKQTIQSPTTVYPTLIAAIGGISAITFGVSVLTVGALAGGALAAIGGFAGTYILGKDKLAGEYINSIRRNIIKRRESILEGLEEELSSVDEHRGVTQIGLFREKYDNLVSILGKKLDPNELTYVRYLTMAEQVFLAGIDNLESIALALESISAIDISNIDWQIEAAIDSNENNSAQNLKDRKNLYESQIQRGKALLAQNEAALTQLDQVTAKLANIKTEQGHAVMDIEGAMSELGDLIDRADRYTVK